MYTAVVGRTAEAQNKNWPGSCAVLKAFRGLTVQCGRWQNRRSAKSKIGQGPVLFASISGPHCTMRSLAEPPKRKNKIWPGSFVVFQACRSQNVHCGRWQNRRSTRTKFGQDPVLFSSLSEPNCTLRSLAEPPKRHCDPRRHHGSN